MICSKVLKNSKSVVVLFSLLVPTILFAPCPAGASDREEELGVLGDQVSVIDNIPTDIAVDSYGNIFIPDIANNIIAPISVDSYGNVFIQDTGNSIISLSNGTNDSKERNR